MSWTKKTSGHNTRTGQISEIARCQERFTNTRRLQMQLAHLLRSFRRPLAHPTPRYLTLINSSKHVCSLPKTMPDVMIKEWAGVLFSDESRFCLESSDRCARVIRRPNERYAQCSILGRQPYGGGSVMVED
jgi:hypothetical protein